LPIFFLEQDEKVFLANGVWKTANKFGTFGEFYFTYWANSSAQFDAEGW